MRNFILIFICSIFIQNCGIVLLTQDLNPEKDNFSTLARLVLAIVPAGSLIHYFPMDDTIFPNDVTQNGLDMNSYGVDMPVLVSDRFGVPNHALYYNGAAGTGATTQSAANGNQVLDGSTSSYTISFWAKGTYPASPGGGSMGIFIAQGNGFGIQYYKNYPSSCGSLRAFTNNGSVGDVDLIGPCNFVPEIWHQIIFVWDLEQSTASLYVDNILIAQQTNTGSQRPWNVNAKLSFAYSPLGSNYVEVTIDEFKIYNMALSPNRYWMP
ncbi:LamG domain-containing protein [Leptospira dzoumogneensis]|uniref:LamG domain-containing protein n=1 Tax=Leptospira dzoumogneensis TaxID=2484904 RepID=A0A4Z1ACZ6_9LEPT|nr:LamG domain-containing protein [Leptospira dzoumogneensis]TGM99604.1 LamG domain-containing protein [Leptospira dzoumogneensis]